MITDTPTTEHQLLSTTVETLVNVLRLAGLDVELKPGGYAATWKHPVTSELMQAVMVTGCISLEFEGRDPQLTTATVIKPWQEPLATWTRVRAGKTGKFGQFRYRTGTNPYDSGIQIQGLTFDPGDPTWGATRRMFTDDELSSFFGFTPPTEFLA